MPIKQTASIAAASTHPMTTPHVALGVSGLHAGPVPVMPSDFGPNSIHLRPTGAPPPAPMHAAPEMGPSAGIGTLMSSMRSPAGESTGIESSLHRNLVDQVDRNLEPGPAASAPVSGMQVLFTEGPGTGNSFHSVEADQDSRNLDHWAREPESGQSNIKMGLTVAAAGLAGTALGAGGVLVAQALFKDDGADATDHEQNPVPAPEPTPDPDNWPDDPSWAGGGGWPGLWTS